MNARSRLSRMLGWTSLIVVAAVLAEELTVQVQKVDVRSGKGSMHAVIATLKQSDKLTVVEKQPDGWLRVAVAGKEGFVKDTALVPPKGGPLGDAFKNVKIGKTEASDATASNAGRGLDEAPLAYAQANNYRTDGLEEMLKAAESVAGVRFDAFTGEGKVGPRR